MRKIPGLLFLCFFLFGVAPCHKAVFACVQDDPNKILWSSDRKLSWNDFKGLVDTSNVAVKAMTYSEIKIDGSYLKDSIHIYKVGCYFLTNRSWHVVNDSSTLSHEQLHFDISELFARKIRKSFDSLYVKRIVDVEKHEKLFNLYIQNCDKYQDLYDSEVYFNEKKQLFWKKKIAAELLKLKEWGYIPEK